MFCASRRRGREPRKNWAREQGAAEKDLGAQEGREGGRPRGSCRASALRVGSWGRPKGDPSRPSTSPPGAAFQGSGRRWWVGAREAVMVITAGPEVSQGPLSGLAAFLGLELNPAEAQTASLV